ncbi:MAG: hypothetical protein HYV02_02195 [Deltaproteobacteria bacterium]|nr:hypothetical protein [Deltaproteobacteria bacterium]
MTHGIRSPISHNRIGPRPNGRTAVYFHQDRGYFGDAAVQTFLEVARARRLHPLILTPPAGHATHLDAPNVTVVEADLASGHDVIRALHKHLPTTPPVAIVASYERHLIPAARARAYFDVPGITLRTARRFRDKSDMHATLRRASPKHFVLPEALDSIHSRQTLQAFVDAHHGRAVVKLRVGSGCREVYPINDGAIGAVWDTIARHPRSYRVEEFLDTRTHQFHVDTLRHGGTSVFAVPSQYTYNVLGFRAQTESPGTISRHHDTDPVCAQLRQANEEILSILGLTDGAAHAEFFEVGGRLVFGEVGARVGGGPIRSMLTALTGLDPMEGWFRMQLDPSYIPRLPQQRTSLEVGALVLSTPQRGTITAMTDPTALIHGTTRHVALWTCAGDEIASPAHSVEGLGFALVEGRNRKKILDDFAGLQQSFSVTMAPCRTSARKAA